MIMITIRAFDTPEEAHLVKGQLEAAGISAVIRNEYTVGVDWGLSNAVGGVQVQVSDSDVEAAKSVLGISPNLAADDLVVCPSCGSKRTEPFTLTRRIALFSLFVFSIPIPFSRYRFQCLDCQHKWRLEK
jgi:hypothetical protein